MTLKSTKKEGKNNVQQRCKKLRKEQKCVSVSDCRVSESTFIKKLRKELDDETKESLFKIIDMIAKERDLNTTES